MFGAMLALGLATGAVQAKELPGSILIKDGGVMPENITSDRSGTIWFSSAGKGTIYRALPGAAEALPWIAGGTDGMSRSLGVLADDARKLVWVCAPGDRPTETNAGTPASIKSFDMKTGALRASYAFEGGGRCNDMTIVADGAVYATDFDGGRIMRLKKGDDQFRVWVTGLEPGADGIARLADGHFYVNNFKNGSFARVPVNADGTAGAPVAMSFERPFGKPDGMRAVGPDRLLMVEGEGRLVEITVKGASATVKVVASDLPDSPAGVTLIGSTAYVVQANWAAARDPAKKAGPFGAVAVPYRAAGK